MDLPYDVPVVVAEVNADVHMVVVRQGQVISRSIDTERVGSLVCTKAVGLPRPCNITANYKATKGQCKLGELSGFWLSRFREVRMACTALNLAGVQMQSAYRSITSGDCSQNWEREYFDMKVFLKADSPPITKTFFLSLQRRHRVQGPGGPLCPQEEH